MERLGRSSTTAVMVMSLALPVGSAVTTSAHAAPATARAVPLVHAIASPPGHPCRHGTARCGQVMRRLDPAGGPGSAKIGIAYELYLPSDRSRPPLGTIVASEGGPGYSTTDSRSYYLDLFRPLLGRRQLLLVDNRGTGKSDPIRCPRLQSYQGNRNRAIAECGAHLGATADLYGSAFAADDLAAVLDRLGIGRVDLYGDSYGTFFGQTFAVRHPKRVRTLTLDAAYFVGGTDPWYSDTNRAIRHAFTIACRRSPDCAARPGRPMHRLARLVQQLRHHPIAGVAPNADGRLKRTRVTVNTLIDLLTGAATTPTIYRELDAATRAALAPHPYTKPLLRLGREVAYVGGAGPVTSYSEGLYVAVACNDYPQAYDVTAPVRVRSRQFHRATARLHRDRPGLFGPFRAGEWVSSPYGYFDDCLRWPAPSRWVHPVPPHASYPNVPTLVLDGDLDSLTSPEGARATADAFPNSTFVETANTTHVSALVDFDACASVLVRRFVRHRDAGDTSCASRYHANRLVDRFVRRAAGTGWDAPRVRTARVAAATTADVLARWWSMYGTRGVGLQGGWFTVHGGWFGASHPVVRWQLHRVRWVEDVSVSGRMTWHRRSGLVLARVAVAGSGTAPAHLRLRWNDQARHARATATGTIRGQRVSFHFPAS